MTSNAGSSDQSTGGLGFNKSEEQLSEEKTRKALAQFLRPEFLGRVDEVIAFKPLTEETLQGIAALMLDEYKPGMEAKGIAYSYTPAASRLWCKRVRAASLVRAICAASFAKPWKTPPPSA